jgi:hypothetical protein
MYEGFDWSYRNSEMSRKIKSATRPIFSSENKNLREKNKTNKTQKNILNKTKSTSQGKKH